MHLKKINSELHKGQFTTNNFLNILIHELGHNFYFYDWEEFKINHIFYLKQFLGQKINNLNKFVKLDKEKVLRIFANSNIDWVMMTSYWQRDLHIGY
ncbi:hypothetical protein SKUN_001606 [Spiroplasma kunkelii CR2-3x]|uniref:Uncharacterized protein n=1 Tax=Spiroplasma kunkelii CR2-3x TaxID=273035 RepID=A0A0K2JJ49_SPIKU|nr:hypothetical protein SKUN_001606 [Spiroplasma kunkelii CR2-3x]